MKRLKYIVIIIACVLPTTVLAQMQYLFKTLGTRDGLTSSQINCILKDERGFMWFGTPAGLYRYDGYLFTHFQADSQDSSSLPDSYIESIQEAMGGDLWIKTASGYCIYHPQSESFERDMRQVFARLGISEPPQIIYIDSRQNLWGYIPSRGIVCYNMQQQLTYEFGYANSAHSIPQGNVCAIGECAEGAVIVYDDGRLVCCTAARQQATLWKNAEIAQRHLRRSNTLRVFADQNNIWLYGHGTLFVFDKATGKWNTTVGDALGLTSVNVDAGINAMAADHAGNLWMATSRQGLMKIQAGTFQMESIPLNNMRMQQRLVQTTSVQSVYVDNSGLLWVGTSRAGVAYVGDNIYKFDSSIVGDITAIVEDGDGRLWLGTSDDGIIGYDGRLVSQKVTAMAYTSDGSLWVGSRQNGLTRLKNGKAHFYSSASDSLRSTLTNDHINDLAVDKVGNLWVATDGGLSMYNLRQGIFSNYNKENRKLITNNITSLHYGSANRLLIGTSDGLLVMDLANMQVQQYTGNSTNMQRFTNSYVTQVFEDSRGLIWIGTREGVNIFNIEEDILDNLTEKKGLCSNNICGIAEDGNKNVWVTTTNGASRIVLQRNHDDGTYSYSFYNYSSNDGLQSDEFNQGAIFTLSDGNVVMGGLNGMSRVKPRDDRSDTALPRVMLTQLFIGEEEVLIGHSYDGNVILPQALNESYSVKLNNDQNSITVKFAAGNYNQSERLQFMYWMEHLDTDWRNGDAMNHGVTFTNLPSGRYKLHVKAINSEGSISDEERSIEIIISKPWYLQWWMLLFYVLVILAILYLWKKGIEQLRMIWKRKNAIIAELVQQRDDIKAASDELRQPMSRMTSIIMNLAERENATTEDRDQLNALHSQLLTIITRVSDMQTALEHPEETARKNVSRSFEFNNQGVMELPELMDDEFTSEIHPAEDLPTAKFRIFFIDDNADLIKFVTPRLRHIYNFRPYTDIIKAAHDIETVVPDLVVVKHDMEDMTGSELCNNIKMHHKLNSIKVVLLTDKNFTPEQMASQDITLSADDYMVKPFNLQDAVARFNKLLGVSTFEEPSSLIEGAETRMLENRNSSMTTATENQHGANHNVAGEVVEDELLKELSVKAIHSDRHNHQRPADKDADHEQVNDNQKFDFYEDGAHFSMNEAADQQLLNSIEQYVQQNMSRGPINLEEMAGAMGMSMKPFFQKVRSITGKTPAEVVRDLRLKHACILLQRTNINMSELAGNIGFATAEHFINLFKERFGISPSDYRMRYRQ